MLTRTHGPLSILADPHALARLLELEVLQELDAIGILRVALETSLPLPSKPFWERACGRRTGYCVHRDGGVICELHGKGKSL